MNLNMMLNLLIGICFIIISNDVGYYRNKECVELRKGVYATGLFLIITTVLLILFKICCCTCCSNLRNENDLNNDTSLNFIFLIIYIIGTLIFIIILSVEISYKEPCGDL